MTLAGYRYFLSTAAKIQWDQAAIDLGPDADAWPLLSDRDRERVHGFVAGFCVGEAGVAEHLQVFASAAPDPDAAACVRAQVVDEARHTAFFDRVASEVLRVPGDSPLERLAVLRSAVTPTFLELFEGRLPAMADGLARGTGAFAEAVGLYHLVLEGAVLLPGQLAFLDVLDELAVLPGLREGLALVHRDERWHVGFGARCLQDAGLEPDARALMDRVLADGEAAAVAWGELAGDAGVARSVQLHRRRMRAAGLLAPSARDASAEEPAPDGAVGTT